MSDNKFNDLHTVGLGYLNRARTVTPKTGKPYEAVSITALAGRVDDPQYVYYDAASIKGRALQKYMLLKEHINSDSKVLVRFKVGDGIPDSYLAKTNDGEVRRHIIKCRLLDITWASIDGQEVVFEPVEEENQEGQQAGSSDAEQDREQQPAQPESLFSDEELDEFVKLDRDDPLFFPKKDELKKLGYRWDSNERAWYKPASVA